MLFMLLKIDMRYWGVLGLPGGISDKRRLPWGFGRGRAIFSGIAGGSMWFASDGIGRGDPWYLAWDFPERAELLGFLHG